MMSVEMTISGGLHHAELDFNDDDETENFIPTVVGNFIESIGKVQNEAVYV